MLTSIFSAAFGSRKGVLRRNWQHCGDGPQAVEYNLSDGSPQHYPQFLAPQQGTRIVLPRRKKSCKRGPGEVWLALWLKMHGVKGFYDNLSLWTGGHRYEPDLAYIDERHGIFIDIENDEPYTMGKSHSTHTLGSDDQRNELITSAGWIVLRFSERQCVATPAQVARTVVDVARSIAPEIEMPKALANVKPVEQESRWSRTVSQNLASQNYRDKYLKKHLPFYRLYSMIFR